MIPVSKFMIDPVGAHEQYTREVSNLKWKEHRRQYKKVKKLKAEVEELKKMLAEACDAKEMYRRKLGQERQRAGKLQSKLDKGE